MVEPPYEAEVGTLLTDVERLTSLFGAVLMGGVWLGIIGVVDPEAEGATEMTEEFGREFDDCVESREENENLLSHDGVWWGANVGDMGGEASASASCRKDGVAPRGIVWPSLFLSTVLAWSGAFLVGGAVGGWMLAERRAWRAEKAKGGQKVVEVAYVSTVCTVQVAVDVMSLVGGTSEGARELDRGRERTGSCEEGTERGWRKVEDLCESERRVVLAGGQR